MRKTSLAAMGLIGVIALVGGCKPALEASSDGGRSSGARAAFDPSDGGSWNLSWHDEFNEFDTGKTDGLMLGFPTNQGQRMQAALLQSLEDTREGLYRHDGHPTVTAHVHNSVAAKNRGGWLMLAKEKDSLKIDAAVTLTFGYSLIPLARQAAEARGSSDVFFEFT